MVDYAHGDEQPLGEDRQTMESGPNHRLTELIRLGWFANENDRRREHGPQIAHSGFQYQSLAAHVRPHAPVEEGAGALEHDVAEHSGSEIQSQHPLPSECRHVSCRYFGAQKTTRASVRCDGLHSPSRFSFATPLRVGAAAAPRSPAYPFSRQGTASIRASGRGSRKRWQFAETARLSLSRVATRALRVYTRTVFQSRVGRGLLLCGACGGSFQRVLDSIVLMTPAWEHILCNTNLGALSRLRFLLDGQIQEKIARGANCHQFRCKDTEEKQSSSPNCGTLLEKQISAPFQRSRSWIG